MPNDTPSPKCPACEAPMTPLPAHVDGQVVASHLFCAWCGTRRPLGWTGDAVDYVRRMRGSTAPPSPSPSPVHWRRFGDERPEGVRGVCVLVIRAKYVRLGYGEIESGAYDYYDVTCHGWLINECLEGPDPEDLWCYQSELLPAEVPHAR